jgi:hypothetical protein
MSGFALGPMAEIFSFRPDFSTPAIAGSTLFTINSQTFDIPSGTLNIRVEGRRLGFGLDVRGAWLGPHAKCGRQHASSLCAQPLHRIVATGLTL